MSAQVTPIRPQVTAGSVLDAIAKLKARANSIANSMFDYADQCRLRCDISRKERNSEQQERFTAMSARAITRAHQAQELAGWCDEAFTDWTFGKLSPRVLLGNVHMAHELLDHIEHPAGQAV